MKDILSEYPGMKIRGRKGVLYDMMGDIFFIGMDGRIERVTSGTVWRCKKKEKVWFEFEIKDFVLCDDPKLHLNT